MSLDGADVLQLSPAELRLIRGARASYVPQDPASALTPGLRVGTQVAETLAAHPAEIDGDPETRMREVLAEVKLRDASSDLLSRYPHQLSGGQQQRVAIAMATGM